MARHRFEEGDDRDKWGGPALLKAWRPPSHTHAQPDDRVAAMEQTGEHDFSSAEWNA